jgi:hypothetical protein
MERLLRVASPLGLYAEEFDAETGRHLGNFPQAFSHLALIEAAARIIVAELVQEYRSASSFSGSASGGDGIRVDERPDGAEHRKTPTHPGSPDT